MVGNKHIEETMLVDQFSYNEVWVVLSGERTMESLRPYFKEFDIHNRPYLPQASIKPPFQSHIILLTLL